MLKDVNCINASDVRQECIWFNKKIIVDNKPLYIKDMYQNSIRTINDILDNEGNFLSILDLNRSFNVNIDVMMYNSIKSSIPKDWRNLVKFSPAIEISEELVIKIGKLWKPITKMYNKEVYWEFVNRFTERPTVLYKWEEYFYWINFDWRIIFMMPYVTCKDTSLQSLQYKILHRFFPCNAVIHKWYPHQSQLCIDCNTEDTIEHYFYECNVILNFWGQLY